MPTLRAQLSTTMTGQLSGNTLDSLSNYLQGGNPHLKGSIYAFSRGWKHNNEKGNYYAILIYFDHSKARISRAVYNFGLKRDTLDIVTLENFTLNPQNNISNINDLKNYYDNYFKKGYGNISSLFLYKFYKNYFNENADKHVIKNSIVEALGIDAHRDRVEDFERNIYLDSVDQRGLDFQEDRKSLENQILKYQDGMNSRLSTDNFHMNFKLYDIQDGKLSAKFYQAFLSEFSRDLFFKNHYHTHDTRMIRYFTNSIDYLNNIGIGNHKPDLTKIADFLLKNGIPFEKKFSDKKNTILKRTAEIFTPLNLPDFVVPILDNNKFMHINIPKNYDNVKISKFFSRGSLYLNPYVISKDSPECLKDLRSLINSHTVNNIFDLDKQINFFNRAIIKKITKIKGG